MIAFNDIFDRFASRTLFLTASGSVSYREFGEMVMRAKESANAGFSIRLSWTPESLATFVASLQYQPVTALCEIPQSADIKPFMEKQPVLVLKTGGTTGKPKHVVHAVERLFGRYPIMERAPSRSLVLFEADHIAGLDAFMQAMRRGATLVIPGSQSAFGIVRAIEELGVDVLPATPTFLQFLLLSSALDGRVIESVKTIPHGAEPMSAELGQRIQRAFPKARLLQRFGLTELGALPVKPDPRDPSALFLKDPDFLWKIEDGELLIQAPTQMLGTLEDGPLAEDDSWYWTGDVAEANSYGAIRILGRREAMINVGGRKVLPETVENFILQQDGVRDVAVYPEPNPLTGQTVAADVVFERDPVPAIWLQTLRRAAIQEGLDLVNVPTHIRPVKQIRKTRVGKRLREPGKA